MRAHGGFSGVQVALGMTAAEAGTAVRLTDVDEAHAFSRQLHFAFTLLCRGEALSIVRNSGQGEGFQAWQKLTSRCEQTSRTRLGALKGLMNISYTGDIQTKLELFERSIHQWEQKASETLSSKYPHRNPPDLHGGRFISKEHLVMNSSRFTT